MGNSTSGSVGAAGGDVRKSSGGAGSAEANELRKREIARMDSTVRNRVHAGVQYNMKLIIRGERASGKTSLFRRFQGLAFTPSYAPTPEIQTATISWNFRNSSEDAVKVEVWDVVDAGFVPPGAVDIIAQGQGISSTPSTRGVITTGKHRFGALDASVVDVYKSAQAVIFMINPFSFSSLDYVRAQAAEVPVGFSILLLLNFRDRVKRFQDDPEPPSYDNNNSSSASASRNGRRPVAPEEDEGPAAFVAHCKACHEANKALTWRDQVVSSDDVQALAKDLRTMREKGKRRKQSKKSGAGEDEENSEEEDEKECDDDDEEEAEGVDVMEVSSLNCFGLRELHKYLSLPFLRLKQQSLRERLDSVKKDLEEAQGELSVAVEAQATERAYADFARSFHSRQKDKGSKASSAALVEQSNHGSTRANEQRPRDEEQEEEVASGKVEEETPTQRRRRKREEAAAAAAATAAAAAVAAAAASEDNGEAGKKGASSSSSLKLRHEGDDESNNSYASKARKAKADEETYSRTGSGPGDEISSFNPSAKARGGNGGGGGGKDDLEGFLGNSDDDEEMEHDARLAKANRQRVMGSLKPEKERKKAGGLPTRGAPVLGGDDGFEGAGGVSRPRSSGLTKVAKKKKDVAAAPSSNSSALAQEAEEREKERQRLRKEEDTAKALEEARLAAFIEEQRQEELKRLKQVEKELLAEQERQQALQREAEECSRLKQQQEEEEAVAQQQRIAAAATTKEKDEEEEEEEEEEEKEEDEEQAEENEKEEEKEEEEEEGDGNDIAAVAAERVEVLHHIDAIDVIKEAEQTLAHTPDVQVEDVSVEEVTEVEEYQHEQTATQHTVGETEVSPMDEEKDDEAKHDIEQLETITPIVEDTMSVSPVAQQEVLGANANAVQISQTSEESFSPPPELSYASTLAPEETSVVQQEEVLVSSVDEFPQTSEETLSPPAPARAPSPLPTPTPTPIPIPTAATVPVVATAAVAVAAPVVRRKRPGLSAPKKELSDDSDEGPKNTAASAVRSSKSRPKFDEDYDDEDDEPSARIAQAGSKNGVSKKNSGGAKPMDEFSRAEKEATAKLGELSEDFFGSSDDDEKEPANDKGKKKMAASSNTAVAVVAASTSSSLFQETRKPSASPAASSSGLSEAAKAAIQAAMQSASSTFGDEEDEEDEEAIPRPQKLKKKKDKKKSVTKDVDSD